MKSHLTPFTQESSLVSESNTQTPKTESTDAEHPIIVALTKVMSMNRLSLESLLARFFDANMLSAYCTSRLGQSGKGNSSVLASRICRAWGKPTFEPNALDSTGADKASSAKKSAATTQPQKRKRPASTSPAAGG